MLKFQVRLDQDIKRSQTGFRSAKQIEYPHVRSMKLSNSALIGHTGYVGSNLAEQVRFDDFFNSSNIAELGRREYDTVVCAAAPGFKIGANDLGQDRAGRAYDDAAAISGLIASLAQLRCRRFVLISTLSVYAVTSRRERRLLRAARRAGAVPACACAPIDDDDGDDDDGAPIDESVDVWCDGCAAGGLGNHAYGRNRARLELFARRRWSAPGACVVLRLPGIYGARMRKNYLFDLLTRSQWLFKVQLHTRHQWYPLRLLGADLLRVLEHNDKVPVAAVNLFTAPLRTHTIVQSLFPTLLRDCCRTHADSEFVDDVQTQHWQLFHGSVPGYRLGAADAMRELAAFVHNEKHARARL